MGVQVGSGGLLAGRRKNVPRKDGAAGGGLVTLFPAGWAQPIRDPKPHSPAMIIAVFGALVAASDQTGFR